MMCGRCERRAAIVLDASAIGITKQKPAEAGCPIASFEGYFFLNRRWQARLAHQPPPVLLLVPPVPLMRL